MLTAFSSLQYVAQVGNIVAVLNEKRTASKYSFLDGSGSKSQVTLFMACDTVHPQWREWRG